MTCGHYCRFPRSVIKKVNISMGPFLGGYGVTGVFCHDCPPVNRTLLSHSVALNQVEQAQSGVAAICSLCC